MKRLLFIIILLNSLAVQADPTAKANSIYNNLKGQFDSGDAIANNLQKPLTTGSTMTTLDGTGSFNAQFSCNAESEFLRVETNAAIFNNVTANISMDTDLNGSYDYTHSLSTMSSVCRNGYVRCATLGLDYEDCQHYELSYDDSGINHILLESNQDRARLYGCECYNSDCGADLANEASLSKLSANIATMVSTGFANHNPRFIASRVETADNVTTYFGQDVTTCGAGDSSGASTISDFANAKRGDDGNFLMSAGTSAIEAAPEGSPIDIIATQQANTMLPRYSEQTCTVTRNMSYRTEPGLLDEKEAIFKMFSQGQRWVRCEYDLANGTATCSSDGKNLQYEFEGTIDIDEMCNSDTTVDYSLGWWTSAPGAWHKLDSSVNTIQHQIPSCANGLTGDVEVKDTSSGSGHKWYLSRALTFTISKPTCIFEETINDTCAVVDTSVCTLFDENVDGTKTFSNSFPTGFSASPSAVIVTNGNCTSTETRDWHTKSRKYECDSGAEGFDPDLSHLQEPTITGDSAEITLSSGTYTLTRPTVTQPACQETCEVQTSVIDTQTNIDGHASEIRLDETRLSKVFKSCSNSVCPLEAGESVIQPCGCSNNFGKAATAMQMLRLAGKDFICTSGTSTEY